MEEDTTVTPETLDGNDGGTITEETLEEVPEENEELTKAQEIARNQEIRAKKAEKEAKELKDKLAQLSKEDGAKPDSSGVSLADQYALLKADVDPEDVSEVLEYAKWKNISVKDALASTAIKSVLAEKKEMRESAQATNTRAIRGTTSKLTDDALLKRVANDPSALDKMSATEREQYFFARRGRKPQ